MLLQTDANNIDKILAETLIYATNYLNSLDERHVSAENTCIENVSPNDIGLGASETL